LGLKVCYEVVLVSLRVLFELITANALFCGYREHNPEDLHVVILKFVKEFISLNYSRKDDFGASFE